MRLLLLAAAALAAQAAQAGSFATSSASSASEAGSSASGSVSDSLKTSSNSSGGERRAEGRYRVTEVARADAGKLRLKLQREGAADLELTLPQAALAARAVNVGDEVQATPQPYGIAFAHADTGQAFFLVLEDSWQRELTTRVVKS